MIVVTYDGNDINDGVDYTSTIPDRTGFPTVTYKTNIRPGSTTVPGSMAYQDIVIPLLISIDNSGSLTTLQQQLSEWFNPRGNVAKQLIVKDDDGSNTRYLYCLPSSMTPIKGSGRRQWLIRLLVDGTEDPDGRLRGTTENSVTWDVSATGDQQVVNNTGEDEAYPILEIRPDVQKTGEGWGYRQFIPIIFKGQRLTVGPYPVDIMDASWDSAALVTAGKARSDGADIRVTKGAVNQEFWMGNYNTTSSRLWVNLDWPNGQTWDVLSAAVGTGVEYLYFRYSDERDISNPRWPKSGHLIIGSEICYFQQIRKRALRLVRRGLYGTTAATHTTGTTFYFIHHPLFLSYGHSTASAPSQHDFLKPVFNINTSTNESLIYTNMMEEQSAAGADVLSGETMTPNYRPRLADWFPRGGRSRKVRAKTYTGNQDGGDTNPAQEVGIYMKASNNRSLPSYLISDLSLTWTFYNPFGIENINITNGEKWVLNKDGGYWNAEIQSSQWQFGEYYRTKYSIPTPTVSSAWQAWSVNQALLETTRKGSPLGYPIYVRLSAEANGYDEPVYYVEFSDVTLTIDSTYVPDSSIRGTEEANVYTLDAVIKNNTTEEEINVAWVGKIGETLTVDTDARTVVDEETGANEMRGFSLGGDPRRDWITLAPGNNTLEYTEAGAQDLRILVKWRNRYFD